MQSTRIESITKARSLNDIRGILSAISCDVISAARAVKKMQSFSGSDELVMDGHDTKRLPQTSAKVAKFVPPKAAELKKHSAILDKLNDNCKELESTLVFVKQAFAGNKKLSAVVSAINELLDSANDSLQKSFTVMGDIAEKHMPAPVQSLADKIIAQLKEEFIKPKLASGITYETYVIVDPQDNKKFQFCCYIGLENLKDASGYTFKEFYYVLTAIVDTQGQYSYSLNSFPDFKIPGSYPMGKEIDSPNNALKRLDFLIGHNNFRVEHEKQAINEVKAGATNRNIAQLASVETVSIKDDEIAVKLKPTVKTKSAMDKAITDIMALLSMLVKKSRNSRFVYRTTKKGESAVLTFRLVGDDEKKDKSASINVSKIDEVSEALGLTDAQIKALRFAFQH